MRIGKVWDDAITFVFPQSPIGAGQRASSHLSDVTIVTAEDMRVCPHMSDNPTNSSAAARFAAHQCR